jgi:hypothetical protein
MQPQDDLHHPEQPRAEHRGDPTASSKSLAIALVVATAFLLAAIGIIVWLVFGNKPAPAVVNKPADDVASVKSVSFVVPADLPVSYARNDQSKVGSTTIFYYDNATNCGITLGVAPVPADKPVKDAVTDALAAAGTQGVATVSKAEGTKSDLKDSVSGKAYTFNAIDAEQTVDVPGVTFTKQNNTILYKQFGTSIASLGYACKAETWAEKKIELAAWVQKFTVKTER